MKSLARLLLLAALAFSTAGFSPSRIGPDIGMPGKKGACEKIRAARVCVSVSTAKPSPRTSITVYGSFRIRGVPQDGESMKATYRYRGTVATCQGTTDDSGAASCIVYFPGGKRGNVVQVKVKFEGYTVDTSFRP